MSDAEPYPDCPRCGCPEAHTIEHGTRWGHDWRKLRCALCGKTWTHTAAAQISTPKPSRSADPAAPVDTGPPPDGLAVAYPLIRCPACDSTETRITSTRRPLRYHRCSDCGHTFKSREQ